MLPSLPVSKKESKKEKKRKKEKHPPPPPFHLSTLYHLLTKRNLPPKKLRLSLNTPPRTCHPLPRLPAPAHLRQRQGPHPVLAAPGPQHRLPARLHLQGDPDGSDVQRQGPAHDAVLDRHSRFAPAQGELVSLRFCFCSVHLTFELSASSRSTGVLCAMCWAKRGGRKENIWSSKLCGNSGSKTSAKGGGLRVTFRGTSKIEKPVEGNSITRNDSSLVPSIFLTLRYAKESMHQG